MSEKGFLKQIGPWALLWVLATLTLFYITIDLNNLENEGSLSEIFKNNLSFYMGYLGFISILMGIIILFVHDVLQSENPIQRRFPVLYWGRWMAVKLGPLFRQYWFTADLEEKPFNRITRNWVYATSKGKKNTIGFGSQVDFDAVGTYTVMPSMFGKKGSGEKYNRIIGKYTNVENPVKLKHFVNISAMSYGSLSARAVSALNKGAGISGIFHNTGEGGLAPYHNLGGNVIFQLGTGKFGCRDKDGEFSDDLFAEIVKQNHVKMIELKIMQGAKPGKGGILPKNKITKEISKIRKVKIGEDVLSPPRHSEFEDINGMFDFIERLRNISKKPVGIKIVVGHTEEIEEIAKKMAANPGSGPDFISVDGGEGGTGAAPLVLASHAGVPMKQAIAITDWAMRKHGVRDKIHLFSSGQIATPIDVVVAMALGADGVNIARSFMLSLGCIQALDCNSNRCPTGIATQDPMLQLTLDVDAAAQRVANYVKTLEKEVYMLCESCGYSSPDELTADDVMVVTSPGHLDFLSELHAASAWESAKELEKAKLAGMTVGEYKQNIK